MQAYIRVEHTTATLYFSLLRPIEFTLKFTEPVCLGQEYWEANVHHQLLIGHAFVCLSSQPPTAVDAVPSIIPHASSFGGHPFTHCSYPCPPSLIAITRGSQVKFDTCRQPVRHPGYIQHNESGTWKVAVLPAGQGDALRCGDAWQTCVLTALNADCHCRCFFALACRIIK